MYEDTNCDSLANLSILDPPRWGWSAIGGITDLTSPHERARRSKGRREFLNAQTREKKRLAKEEKRNAEKKEKKTTAKKAKAALAKDKATPVNTFPSTALSPMAAAQIIVRPGGAAAIAAAASAIAAEAAAASAIRTQALGASSAIVPNIPSNGIIQEGSATIQHSIAGTAVTIGNAAGNITASVSSDILAETATQIKNPQNLQLQQDSTTNNISALGTNVQSTTQPEPPVQPHPQPQPQPQGQTASSDNATKLNSKKGTTSTIYDFGPHYNIINKPKGRSKRDRFDIEVKAIREDGTVHPGAYHRGIVHEEPRYRGRGYLLCDTDPTDTNHGWDEPDLKLKVKIEFPICDPDWSDDEDDDARNVEEAKTSLRRNARRGESKTFVSETERRIKRKEKLAELPHFRDIVEWDLLNARTPTPMVYAGDIAAEFGLSFNRTLDLARSIQKQIDAFVRESVNYHVPVSAKDHLLLPRGKHSSLQPPKYSNPKLLQGGHCARNVTTTFKPFEVREFIKKEVVITFDEPMPASKDVVAAKVPPIVKEVKAVQFEYEVAKPEDLPKHDISKLGIDPIYLPEFLRRAREENQKALKLLADDSSTGVGSAKIITNDSCHFCHIRRPQLVLFACGNSAHAFCDLHTCRRLGFRAEQALSLGLDWCPVCSLQCTCYRCHTRVNVLLPQFAKQCKKQGLGPAEVDYDFVFNCSRNLGRMVKDVLKKSTAGSTAATAATTSRRKSSGKEAPTAIHADFETVEVPKVPKEDFPAEMSSGLNKDPCLKDDYISIFTPKGSVICEKAAKEAQEAKPDVKVATVVEDGNVDYCFECQQSGDLICCDKCPRGFHRSCLGGDVEIKSGQWECPRCLQDSSEQNGDAMTGAFSHDKLLTVFNEFSETRDFTAKVKILSKIFDMVKALIDYDFGSIFSEPVDVKQVRDYKVYVKRPMDLGTITSSLLKGAYCKVSPNPRTKELVGVDQVTEMDVIVFKVLKDIEQIWHNCFLYNREGSSFHRMGQVLRRKCAVIQKASYEADLDPFVTKNLDIFADECKENRMELSNSLKPWIPACKYQINIQNRGNTKAKVIVGILDKDTSMVIKQYTSVSASFAVAEFLSKLGHSSEVKTCNKQKIREYIRAMQVDPSLTLFGYRWIYMDNIRSGKFTLSAKVADAIIRKQCKISQAVLEEYSSIEDAHKSWLNALSKCVGATESIGEDKSVEYFQKCYLDGGNSLDAQEWVRIKKETICELISDIGQSASEVSKPSGDISHKMDEPTSIDDVGRESCQVAVKYVDKPVANLSEPSATQQDAPATILTTHPPSNVPGVISNDNPNGDVSDKLDEPTSIDVLGTESNQGAAKSLDKSIACSSEASPTRQDAPATAFDNHPPSNVPGANVALLGISVSGRVGVLQSQESSAVSLTNLLSQTTAAVELASHKTSHRAATADDVTTSQETHLSEKFALNTDPVPQPAPLQSTGDITMNEISETNVGQRDTVMTDGIKNEVVVRAPASAVEGLTNDSVTTMKMEYGNDNIDGSAFSIDVGQGRQSVLEKRAEVAHIPVPDPPTSAAKNSSTRNEILAGEKANERETTVHTAIKIESIQNARLPYEPVSEPVTKTEVKIESFQTALAINTAEAKNDGVATDASNIYASEIEAPMDSARTTDEAKGAASVETKHGFSLEFNDAQKSEVVPEPYHFQSPSRTIGSTRPSAIEVDLASVLLDFSRSVSSPASVSSSKKRSSDGVEDIASKKQRQE